MVSQPIEDHSRYRKMVSQEYAPGVCFVTGTPNGPFIDTGIYIPKERFGQLVLSKDFIEEAAHLLGLFDDVETQKQNAYDEGYRDATKENVSGVLDRALAELGFATAVLGGLRLPADAVVEGDDVAAPAEGAETVAAGGIVDSAESTDDRADEAAGQGDGAAVDDRPAGVSAGASDVDPFRV